MDSKIMECNLKAVKLSLECPSKDLSDQEIRNFFNGSKAFLSELVQNGNTGVSTDSPLFEWFSVLTSLLRVHYRHNGVHSKCSVADLELLLSSLNYILFYLIKVKGVPQKWFKYLGSASLEFLACYSRMESHKEDFANAIAQKSYCFLCSIGKEMVNGVKESKDKSFGDGYELCLLGCVFSNLDISQTDKSGLRIARNFLSNYNQLANSVEQKNRSSVKTELQSHMAIFRLALIICCSVRGSMNENKCLFFVEMFRLVVNCPDLRRGLLDCGGNLFKIDLAKDDGFPCYETAHLMKQIGVDSQADIDSSVTELRATLPICHLIDCLKRVETSQKDMAVAVEVEQHINQVLSKVQGQTPQDQSRITRVPQLLTESFSLLITNLPDVNHFQTSTMLAYHKLLSVCTEMFARDTLVIANDVKPSKACTIKHHTACLDILNKHRLQAMQVLVDRCDLNKDDLPSLAATIKAGLNQLCTLAQTTRKRALLAVDSSAYKRILRCLSNAFMAIGSIGRQLRRLEKHDATIIILSSLWPVSCMSELLSSLSHHENLCEAHRLSGNVTAAVQVVAQAVRIDPSLVSTSLMKSLIRMARDGANINVINLFSCCEDQGKALFLQFTRAVIVSRINPTLSKHVDVVLRHILNSNQLSPPEQAKAHLLLGECCWYNNRAEEVRNKPESCKEPLSHLQKAIKLYAKDGRSYGDLFAQALLLEAEIQHTHACLIQTEMEGTSSSDNFEEESSEENSPLNSMPGLLSRSIAPQTPLEGAAYNQNIADVFHTPAASKARMPQAIKPKRLNMDKSLSQDNSGDESMSFERGDLLNKAHSALALWKAWFKSRPFSEVSSASPQKEKDEKSFRVDRSMILLQRLAQLAVINHQLVFAVDCYSQAYLMSSSIGRTNLLLDLKLSILPLLGKLGLITAPVPITDKERAIAWSRKDGGADLIVSIIEDVLNGSEPDKEENEANYVPLASYFYSTHRFAKCVDLLKKIMKRVKDVKQKGALTPALTLAFVESKRLTAKISSCPGSAQIYKSCGLEVPYALEAVAEAVKYVTSAAVCFMGNDFKNASGRGVSFNSWQLIHEYLMTVSLSSRLLLEAGNVKYARTYLQEGLKTARSCLLDSWCGIFLSALARVSLHGFDAVAEASNLAQAAFETVKDVQEISFAKEHSSSDSMLEEDYPDLHYLEQDPYYAPGQQCGKDCELCKLNTLPSTFNPPLIKATVELLWTQAEVALQATKNKTKAFQLLHSAMKLATHLHKFAVHKEVNAMTDVVDVETSFRKKGVHSYQLLHLETMLKMAQVSFQAFFMSANQSEEEGASSFSNEQRNEILKIKDLCTTILVKGKTVAAMGKAKIIMASAQLIQIQLDYLPHWFKERNNFKDGGKDVEEEDNLSEAVRELRMDEEYWNSERQRKLKEGLGFEFFEAAPVTKGTDKSQNTTSTSRHLKQFSTVTYQLGEASEKLEEFMPGSASVSQVSAHKRTSPLSSTGTESAACAKSSRKQTLSGPKSIQGSKVGSRPGRKNSKAKAAPVLCLGSYDVYNDIGEDGLPPTKPISLNEMNAASQKDNRCESETAAGVQEQSSKSPKNLNESTKQGESSSDLSPLSSKLAQLKLEASPEDKININKKVRSQRNTHQKRQDVEPNMNVDKPKRRTVRGKGLTTVKDSNEIQISPVVETEVPSLNGFSEEVSSALSKSDKVDESVVVEPKVKKKLGRVVKPVEKHSIESANVAVTRQRRRRKKSPEVDSPEKKREIDAGDRSDGIAFFMEQTALSNQLFPSPVILNGNVFHGTKKHQESWSDEESAERNRLYTEASTFHSPLSRDCNSSQSQDTLEGSTSPDMYVRPVDALLSPMSQNLWSPIEIPRGRPRRVKTEGEGNSTGCGSQTNIPRGKKMLPAMNFETPRGIDDGDNGIEKENISTPDQVESLKPNKSKQGKCNQRTGSKLSLRKNMSAKEESATGKKQPSQGSRHASPGIFIWSSDDESQGSPNSQKKGDGFLMEEDHSTPTSSSQSLGGKNKRGEVLGEKSHVTLSKKGRKKMACPVQDRGKELKDENSRIEEAVELMDEIEENLDPDVAHRIAAKFLTAFPKDHKDEQLEMNIQQSLDALRAFPPSHLYSRLSRWMALRLWNRSFHVKDGSQVKEEWSNLQTSIAALLAESMHVSFYHMLTRNLHHKLRRCGENPNLPANGNKPKKCGKKDEAMCDWSSLDKDNVEKEMTLLNQVLRMSDRDQSVEAAFKTKLQNIPEGWTVVQMSYVNFDVSEGEGGQVLITRMTSDIQPVTVGIPIDRWKCLTRLMHFCKEAVKYDVPESDPEQYWTCRFKRNKDMMDLVYLLQEQFLSGHKWLLCGKPNYRNERIKVVLDEAVEHNKERLEHCSVNTRTVRAILEVLLTANEKDTDSLLQCLWPSSISRVVASIVWEVQMEVSKLEAAMQSQECTRKPVVLLLDKVFNQLPWESMPILSQDVVTRVPSLAALESLLVLHDQRSDSPFQTGVNRQNVVAVIDPETNLENSVTVLEPQFQKYKGWTCLTQQVPTVSDLKAFLKQELYIYNGHGWGRKFVGGDDLQMFKGKAVAIIMGCHSGKMEFKTRTDGDGAPLYFLLAGCPTVLGNLWLVTDKDIDKLTSYMMSYWMSCKNPVSLSHLLNQARMVCKLQGLNGFAPVIYGLPVMMN